MIGVSQEFKDAVVAASEEKARERAHHLGLDYRDGHARCPIDDAPLDRLKFARGSSVVYVHTGGSECSR